MSVPHTFYVYVLARPNGKPFYVGKGKGKRVFKHEIEARRGHHCHRCNIIRKIWKQGGEVQRYIVFTTDDEQEAFDYERDQIALYGLTTLANQTTGGEGMSNPLPTTVAKLRAAQAARHVLDPGLSGRIGAATKAHFDAHPDALAERNAAIKAAWALPERRAKARVAQAKRFSRPEEHAKISEGLRGRIVSDATRAKISAANKARWAERKAQKEGKNND